MTVPKYGIEIDFIDNTIAAHTNGEQGPIADFSEGFMTDSIDAMISHCEDMARKLRDYQRNPKKYEKPIEEETYRCPDTPNLF